jgi:hypothetical protein
MKLTPWSYLLIPLGTRLAVIAGVRVLVACGTRGPTDERLGPFDSTLVSIARAAPGAGSGGANTGPPSGSAPTDAPP